MMVKLQYTPLDEIPAIRDTVHHTFLKGVAHTLQWRRNQLYSLARLAQENADAIAQAIFEDLGRPETESLFAEIGPVVDRCLASAEQLEEWAKPQLVDAPSWQKGWKPTIHKMPKGTVLIIAPWNYPFILSIQPLIGAVAAGCCAVIKPSELSSNFSALLTKLLPKYLDNSAYRIVNGGVEETTKLLELQWNHIFFTGSSRVARIIAAAAAKHLTPLSLELGGKSPVVVDPAYDINLAAKRILWGKHNNAGQVCVAPDYVVIPREKQDEFIQALREHYDMFYPEGALNSTSYGRIISKTHHDRLKSLVRRTKGKIAFGGKTNDKLGFEPTVVRDVEDGDALLEEELFGPILPIVPVANISEAIGFVNARPQPLILHAFTDDPLIKQRLIDTTRSGGLVFNDTFQELSVKELPFSGFGESGYGSQIMKYTFDGFTHLRSTIDMPSEAEPFLKIRYPPYTQENAKALTASVHLDIPESK